jgi:hypothetical protein
VWEIVGESEKIVIVCGRLSRIFPQPFLIHSSAIPQPFLIHSSSIPHPFLIFPQPFHSHSTAIPQPFHSHSTAIPQPFHSHSSSIPHLLMVIPQRFRDPALTSLMDLSKPFLFVSTLQGHATFCVVLRPC